MKEKIAQRFIEKKWAVVFHHTLGWTTSSFSQWRHHALADMKKHKEVMPEYIYKVVPVEIIYYL